MRRLAPLLLTSLLLAGPAHAEQDLLLGADMNSAAMTKAEMTRADVEALIAKANGKSFIHLELSPRRLAPMQADLQEGHPPAAAQVKRLETAPNFETITAPEIALAEAKSLPASEAGIQRTAAGNL